MNILADASLNGLQAYFPPPFKLSFYQDRPQLIEQLPGHTIVLCRSTLKVDQGLLGRYKHTLQYVATASSGVDHLDRAFLEQAAIKTIDARGSNAPSVADYVLSCIAYCEQANGLNGKRAGVIGVGAVGSLIACRLKTLGYEVSCYDPPRAARDPAFQSTTFKEILENDVICIHANLHCDAPFPSQDLIDASALQQIKKNSIIVNASRGGIVCEQALLSLKPAIYYCTDVYAHEPDIDPNIVDYAYLCTPHIAGHSVDAKQNALSLLSQKLHKAYNLPWPGFNQSFTVNDTLRLTLYLSSNSKAQLSWQKQILSFYSPWEETIKLKQAKGMREAFLALRKGHVARHDLQFGQNID